MFKRLVAGASALLLTFSLLPACSSGEDEGSTSTATYSRQHEVAESGVRIRANKADSTMEITRAEPGGTAPKDLQEDAWTIFVYLCGSDLETDGGSATADLSEMVGASGSENVNFVVQTGGAKKWEYDDISGKKTQRLFIQDGSIMEVDKFNAANMGDPETLSDFLTWGVKNYPAEHMGVILWDHGGGSLGGVCYDERYDDDSLSLREIDSALATTFKSMWDKFEFIGFDACLMSTLETANISASYANYLYASEEWEPGTGWDYSDIIEFLAKNPDANGAELGKIVCDSYIDSVGEDKDVATFAITDLSAIDNVLISFNRFSQEMFEATEDAPTLASVARSVAVADNFGGNNASEGYTNMVDLAGMVYAAEDVAPSSEELLGELNQAVEYHREGKTHKGAGGLSLYYPLTIQDSVEMEVFEQVCVSPYYLSFVDRQVKSGVYGTDESYDSDTWFIGDFWNWLFSDDEGEELGAQSEDYWNYVDEHSPESTLITFAEKPALDENDIFCFTLDENGINNANSVSALVYMVSDDGEDAISLGETYDVNGDWETGEFFDQFDGYWLSLPDGQDLCTFVADSTEEYVVYTCPIELNGEETNLRVRVYYEDYTTVVEGAWDGIGANGSSARGIKEIKKGDVIVPKYVAYTLEDADEVSYTGNKYKVDDDFDVYYDFLDEGTYLYEFAITDVYGDVFITDYAVFTSNGEGKVSFAG